MLNIGLSFLACYKVELFNLLQNLDPTMLNIEPVRVIFIYYNVLKFHVPRSISF